MGCGGAGTGPCLPIRRHSSGDMRRSCRRAGLDRRAAGPGAAHGPTADGSPVRAVGEPGAGPLYTPGSVVAGRTTRLADRIGARRRERPSERPPAQVSSYQDSVPSDVPASGARRREHPVPIVSWDLGSDVGLRGGSTAVVTSIRPPDSRRELVSPAARPVRVDGRGGLRVGAGAPGPLRTCEMRPSRSVSSGSVLHRRPAGGLDRPPSTRVDEGTGPRSGRAATVDLTPPPLPSYRVPRPERRLIAGRDGLPSLRHRGFRGQE